jgi:hypothetical protein
MISSARPREIRDIDRKREIEMADEAKAESSILWRRIDVPGHEAARLVFRDGRWHLLGTAVFAHEGRGCRLDYRIACDERWRTVSARVSGWVGGEEVEIEIAHADGRWTMNGAECPQVAGCTDVDLNFSPSTNLLPIRRLGLAVGEEGPAAAAWLRFPGLRLERLDQTYRRLGERAYRYESADGAFRRDIEVDDAGLVTRYPDFWEAEG